MNGRSTHLLRLSTIDCGGPRLEDLKQAPYEVSRERLAAFLYHEPESRKLFECVVIKVLDIRAGLKSITTRRDGVIVSDFFSMRR